MIDSFKPLSWLKTKNLRTRNLACKSQTVRGWQPCHWSTHVYRLRLRWCISDRFVLVSSCQTFSSFAGALLNQFAAVISPQTFSWSNSFLPVISLNLFSFSNTNPQHASSVRSLRSRIRFDSMRRLPARLAISLHRMWHWHACNQENTIAFASGFECDFARRFESCGWKWKLECDDECAWFGSSNHVRNLKPNECALKSKLMISDEF